MASYERAIAINPKYLDVYNNMLSTLVHKQLYERGVRTGHELLRAQPSNIKALIQTAVVEECAGNLADARRTLRRAFEQQQKMGARGLHQMSNAFLNVAMCPSFDDEIDDKINLQHHLAKLQRAYPHGMAWPCTCLYTYLGGRCITSPSCSARISVYTCPNACLHTFLRKSLYRITSKHISPQLERLRDQTEHVCGCAVPYG